MSGWTAKRFWSEATTEPVEGGHAIRLDGRPVKTPAKAPLVVPSQALASAIAAEWQAQEKNVDPRTMPLTRAANVAIDKVTPQFAEVARMLADYGDSDLTCYRAAAPDDLAARQAQCWDPLLDWAAATHGARLIPVIGVVHVPQDPAALAALANAVLVHSPFELTALHDLVALSGSLVIGLAASAGAWPAETLWNLSRIDENWQIEQWGPDDEAEADTANKRSAFLGASGLLDLLRK